MRNALISALVLSSGVALISLETHADEGQWQPYQMPSIADKLSERGIDIPAKQLADLTQYPMNAVVDSAIVQPVSSPPKG